MTTLAEHMIVAGAENLPPMLDKSMYNSWQSRMLLCIKGKKNGRMMIETIKNGPLVYPTIKEDGKIHEKKYAELTEPERLQDECDVQATNIILQGLPLDVYALVNNSDTAKDIWDRVKLLMQGTELSYQECKCKLYNEFDKFTSIKGESLYDKFVTDVKLAKNMYNTNYDQLYAYLSQHKGDANEARLLCERYQDLLALVANHQTQSNTTQRQGQSVVGTRNKGNATNSKGNNASCQALVVKCFNCQGEEHMARQCTQPKRPRNSTWFKEKMLLVWVQESGQVLDEEQLAFLANPGVADG
ncbi:copia protein [Tanacetum coccineum]